MDNVLKRVAAGLQPRGFALPQLIPDGLDPEVHLQLAFSVIHPIKRPPRLPRQVSHDFEGMREEAPTKVARQLKIHELLKNLAMLVDP